MKVLYLDTGFDSSSEYFRKQREKAKGCTNKCLYKTSRKSMIQKILLAVGIYIFHPVLYFVYGDWKWHLDEYDAYIIVSRKAAMYAAKFIRQKYPNKRVIIWYWNLVTDKEMKPSYCKKIGCETWSFDKADCIKFDMKFGDTYYFPIDDKIDSGNGKRTSLFYVGINRPGRKEILNKLGKYLGSSGLEYKFNLTQIPSHRATHNEKFSERMTYEEIMSAIADSNAILDLNRENQTGMTLRPMEALFFKRKLVTNNSKIVDYKIYDPANTYIITDNEFAGLCEFLTKEYIESKENDEKRRIYSFQEWLNRICNNIEAL